MESGNRTTHLVPKGSVPRTVHIVPGQGRAKGTVCHVIIVRFSYSRRVLSLVLAVLVMMDSRGVFVLCFFLLIAAVACWKIK